MKWFKRKLASASANSELLEKNKLPVKQIFFIEIGTRIGFGIKTLVRRKNTYVELICALLIILFLYTGINKLMDLNKFRSEMGRSPFIEDMSGFITYAIPIGEILLSLILVMNKTRLIGLYMSYGLMALFTGYIWLMLNYAYDLPCSCGGIISKLSWEDHLIFNVCFTTLCVLGVVLQSKLIQANNIKKAA